MPWSTVKVCELKSKDVEHKPTAPAPYLSAALINDMMAIFKLNSSLWYPVVRSKSFINV